MKLSLKSTSAFFAGLLLLNLCSCSKKETPKPSDNSTAIAVVYNAYNHAAQYPTTGMVVDATGNLYIADVGGNTIRMITQAGAVTVIAGSGSVGSANGTGTDASFNLPGALAIDAANNIYVADAANNLIRKITPAGVVTTLAGSGAIGAANGPGTTASFNFPQGIAVDNNGNVYVADTGNDLIRKITPDGVVTTLAGKIAAGKENGTGGAATFNIPQGLAVDATGNLYVADADNNLIRKISPAGVVSTFAGSGHAISFDGTGIGASFDFPDALAMGKDGNLYATEAFSNQISKITSDGKVTRLDISQVAPFADAYIDKSSHAVEYYSIQFPNGVAFISTSNNLYVADYGNGLIRQGSGL